MADKIVLKAFHEFALFIEYFRLGSVSPRQLPHFPDFWRDMPLQLPGGDEDGFVTIQFGREIAIRGNFRICGDFLHEPPYIHRLEPRAAPIAGVILMRTDNSVFQPHNLNARIKIGIDVS